MRTAFISMRRNLGAAVRTEFGADEHHAETQINATKREARAAMLHCVKSMIAAVWQLRVRERSSNGRAAQMVLRGMNRVTRRGHGRSADPS
jgi:hypothetical protein